MDPHRRALLVEDLRSLWQRFSDMRFAQMLRVALGARDVGDVTDEELAAAVTIALRERIGRPPRPGPHWDSRSDTGRSFLRGLPRDPARIDPLLEALVGAWDARPDASLGHLLEGALDRAGVPQNESGTRLLLIEDALLQDLLARPRACGIRSSRS